MGVLTINAQKNYESILGVLLDFGELMLTSGAEVNRVEDALVRLGVSYGAHKMNVYATPSNLTITLVLPDDRVFTQSRRMISAQGTDFYKLEKLNSLSRQKCNMAITESEFEKNVFEIKNINPKKNKLYIGSMFAAGSFAIFFGGSVFDAIVAVLFALLICFMQLHFQRFCSNTFMFNLITSFISGACICVLAKILPISADNVIVGDIMLLIPGIAFTNSIRNLLVGDTNTGVMRLVETILWAAALAFGFVLSIMLIGV